MQDCIFCKIAAGEIPSAIVYENEHVIAFKDINPAAPVHVLIVPKDHIANILDLHASGKAAAIMEYVVEAADKIAEQAGLKDRGFRLINNCGEEGGQTVQHLHFHLIGGKKLDEKLV